MCATIKQTLGILYPSPSIVLEQELQQIVDPLNLSFFPTLKPKYSSQFFWPVFTVAFFAILVLLRHK